MKSLTPILTYDCNMECSFCIERDTAKCEMDPEKLLETTAKFLEEKEVGEVCIMGGEPLLYPNLVNAVAYLGKTYGKEVTVFTNGTYWSDDYTEWVNGNGIGVCLSVHTVSGEKPLMGLNIEAIKGIDTLFLTKVVSAGEEWSDFVWLLHTLFNCKVQVTLDVHTIGDMSVKDMYTHVAEYEKLGKPEWIELIGMSYKECSCKDHGMIEPDGTFKTRSGYLGLPAVVSQGCARLEGNMGKEKYDLLRKLLGVAP